ncbi:DNA-processing protein DprA [Baaleninema simplex]|uniref:DNA-processing protein DprA n=1 Tax=Baaleninema simplex TaxID=2862350 RepID=UPI000349C6BF|nr:DNA-processing protein DprA [Baaleninema simplex]
MDERAYWVAWVQVRGVGSILLRRLDDRFGSLEAAWHASPEELQTVEGLGTRKVADIVEGRSQLDPASLFETHLERNPQFWTLRDRDYPHLLKEIPNPPPILYYRGVPDADENRGVTPTVAIVGTRHPTEYGKRWTRRFSRVLSQRGFTIVSGLAAGIDAEAHKACLEAGGRTIAVFGTGVDVVYPHANRSLYQRVLQSGLAVSEYPAGTQPDRKHFPQRNRIIAGLSRAILVTEAPQKSGALITAYVANDFCRDVYAVPGSLDNANSRGCLGLLSRGANLVLDEGHLLEMLGEMPQVDVTPATPTVSESVPATVPPAKPKPKLPPNLDRVFAAISGEPTALDVIVEQSGLEAGIVLSSLAQLELLDLVSNLPGMRYQRL